MLLAIVKDDPAYRIVYLLHIVSFVVAFAPGFVHPGMARVMGTVPADSGRAIAARMVVNGQRLHFPAMILAGLFGIVLILLSDDLYAFDQAWISIAFLIWFAMLAVYFFLLLPAERTMAADPADEAAGKKAAMFGGVLHLLFLLMLVDMIWKPGV